MTRRLAVRLNSLAIGDLVERADGIVEFHIREDYRRIENRPVLGQLFEDDPRATYHGRRDSPLPTFFANLLPEGRLRALFETSGLVEERDDTGLLALLGQDLPGAVIVEPMPDETDGPRGAAEEQPLFEDEDNFRFSLAGVQLKFSVVHDGDKLTLPARNVAGDSIVKLHGAQLPGLAENEFSIMSWAEECGFEVPPCELYSLGELKGLPLDNVDPHGRAFVIRRYDREGNRRIHQEDFAQIANLRPALKYDYLKYEVLGRLIHAIIGKQGFLEFVRRLAFMVATGNGDAHAKNWSLVYRDGVRPTLAPLYDQVFTSAWPRLVSVTGGQGSRTASAQLALKFFGVKHFAECEIGLFERLGAICSMSAESVNEARETFERAADSWARINAKLPMRGEHRTLLHEHWKSVPCLRHYALTDS